MGGRLDAVPADELAVEPGRGVGVDLAIERDGGVHGDDDLAPRALVVGGGALQEVARDFPVVAIEPVDDAGAPQRLQAPNVGLNVPLDIAAGDARVGAGDLVVLPGLVEAVGLSTQCASPTRSTCCTSFRRSRSAASLHRRRIWT
jgi:hypothetical protein